MAHPHAPPPFDSDDHAAVFAAIFGRDNDSMSIPQAPALIGPNGGRYHIRPDIAASIVMGRDQAEADADERQPTATALQRTAAENKCTQPCSAHRGILARNSLCLAGSCLVSDAASSAAAVPGRFPVPLLRRGISLTKNTPYALQGRLAELGAELISTDHAHKLKLLELDTALRTERLVHAEKVGRIERERSAVEKALALVERQEREREAAALQSAIASASSPRSASSASSVASTSTSCLLQSRTPGESATGDETGCGVCLCADRDTLVAPCGHVAMCFACAEAIRRSRNPECQLKQPHALPSRCMLRPWPRAPVSRFSPRSRFVVCHLVQARSAA